MSYELRIKNVSPGPELFRDLEAEYRPIRYPDVTAWIGWRGRPARGVTLTAYEGHTIVKLRGFSSPDDVSLAMELMLRLARARRSPVWVEDVPPDVETRDEEDESAFVPFSPEALERWPSDWFRYQTVASEVGIRDLLRDDDSDLKLSTPGRWALLSRALLQTIRADGFQARRSFFSRAKQTALPIRFASTSSFPIDDYLQWAHPLLMLPVRPRFVGEGKDAARHGPPPEELVEEPPFLVGDYTRLDRPKAAKATFVTLVPDVRQLLSRATHVAIQRGSTWSLMAFDDFLSRAAERLELVDEHSWAFEAPRGRDWEHLWEPVRVALELPDQWRFHERAKDLSIESDKRRLYGEPEMRLLTEARQAKAEGRFEDALRAAADYCSVAPDRGDGHYWASRVYEEMGDLKAARETLELAVRHRHPIAAFRAGMLGDLAEKYFNDGNIEAARTAIEAALAAAPPDWNSRDEALRFQQRLWESSAS